MATRTKAQTLRALLRFLLAAWLISATSELYGQSAPRSESFQVLPAPSDGPQITPYLQYQTDLAWRQDAQRVEAWRAVHTEPGLLRLQSELRNRLLSMIGGLPAQRTPLNAHIVGKISSNGFRVEKLIFESLPGFYVTALLYVPERGPGRYPAVLVPAGHAPDGKVHYQKLCQRLAKRGYVVLAWDPVGQGERSQFWDAKAKKSRYNLICGEHAVLGNLAYLAGANLARWEIWDGLRAFDYLLTRPEVDPGRINITGTSGGGFQAMHIAALEPRIKVAAISCYLTALPMRIHNRIFKDPDSDPEQDLYGMISGGVDHAGLMLLMYPRPIFVAAAVLDFFPIEGTQKSFREVQALYRRFGHADRIAMVEGYHGHEYSDTNQEAAFEFLDHFNHLPATRELAPAIDLDGKALQCTRTGQVITDFDHAVPLVNLIRDYYDAHESKRTGSIRDLYYANGYPEIRSWTLGKYADVSPADHVIAWELVGTSTIAGITIDRYVLHYSHLVMPLLHVHRAEDSGHKWLLWVNPNGKIGVADWPAVVSRVNAGFDIISFDFRGLGETRMRYTAVSEDDPSLALSDFDMAYVNPLSSVLADYVYNSILTGRPYFLQMIEDAEIAIRFSRLKLRAARFELETAAGSGPLAEAIATTLPGVGKPAGANSVTATFWADIVAQRQESWPIEYLLPGGAYFH